MTSKVLILLVTALLFGEGAAVRGSRRELKKGNPDTEDGVAPAFLFGGFGGGGGGGGGKKPDSIIPDFGEQTENAGDKAEDIINNVINFGNNGDNDKEEDDEDNGNINVPRGMDTFFIDERHWGFQDLFLDSDTFTVTNAKQVEVFTVTGMFTELQEIGLESLTVQDSRTEQELFVINQEIFQGWRIEDQTTNPQSRRTVSYEVEEKTTIMNGLLQNLAGIGETEFEIFKVVSGNNANGESRTKMFTTKGDFWGSDFEITRRNGKTMATFQSESPSLSNWGDYYQLNVLEGQDPGLMLSICIVIDQILSDGRGE